MVATATNDNGVTVSATSLATTAVLDAAPTVTTPTIAGTAEEGDTLTASASSGQSDNPVTYQWEENSGPNGAFVAIANATGATYQVQESDEGFQIEVVATATNDNGVTTSATSLATTAVLDAAPTVTTPTIAGTAAEGDTLTASASSGQSDNAVTYQWEENSGPNGAFVAIANATGSTYQVQESDEGFQIEVVATATNDNGVTISAASLATSAVLDAAPTVTTPTIAGTAEEGDTLTASASSGQSDNPVTYQWEENSGPNGALLPSPMRPARPIRSRRATRASRSRSSRPRPTIMASPFRPRALPLPQFSTPPRRSPRRRSPAPPRKATR